MLRSWQAVALVFSLFISGCNDNITTPSGSLGAEASPLLAENLSLRLLDSSGLALALAAENNEVITATNAAESAEDYRALFQEAFNDGFDIMAIHTSPGKLVIIEYWTFEDAVVWDGVSPLESGVLYDLSKNQEVMQLIKGKKTKRSLKSL
jgi:hypothetical protein